MIRRGFAYHLIVLVLLLSCQENKGASSVLPQTIVSDNGHFSSGLFKYEAASPTMKQMETDGNQNQSEWEVLQDSLRNLCLSQCENEILKHSFLQEFYIRGVVKEKNGFVEFSIPFDVHQNDCGAPDCYTTTLAFKFALGDSLNFPDTVDFSEHETGCSSNPYFIRNEFVKTQDKSDYIIYHCAEKSRTLLLYGLSSEYQDALYFLNMDLDKINPDAPFEHYNWDGEYTDQAIYVSHALTSAEYEHFLR